MEEFEPKDIEGNVNVSKSSPIKDFFVLSGALLLIIISSYVILGFIAQHLVSHIPIELEKKFGGSSSFKYASLIKKKSSREAYLQSIVNDMQKKCTNLPYDFRVSMHKSEKPNAMAYLGGGIVVFSGLLEKAESENELAFVLAHEMGHFKNRDHLRGMGRALVLMFVSATLFDSGSSLGKILNKLLFITDLKFSRDQERFADLYAVDLLNCYYGHVGGSTDFFKKLTEKDYSKLVLRFYSTHPLSEDRIKRVRKYISEKGYKVQDLKNIPQKHQENTK